VLAALVSALIVGLGYRYVTSGGMTARRTPSGLEAFIARHLVDLGIDAQARARKSPVSTSVGSADVAAGRALYQQHCQACHGTDGTGKTAAGDGLYPPPPDLGRTALAHRKRTDGELFYLIRNGVRNTGMPAWDLADAQLWDLVAFIRNLPETAPVTMGGDPPYPPARPVEREAKGPSGAGAYVGSASCKPCHAEMYARWIKTPMANVVRDPKEHPDAIIPDMSKPDPLVTFGVGDVALVYGSKWKQRYYKKVGNDYFLYPAQWDVTHAKWKPYFVKADWWVAFYPPDNFQRPTGPLCDGCHSVNYDIATHTMTEWNVGCERCHGPGGEHVKHATAANILNPTRFGYVAESDLCIQCHSQGRPRKNPIGGQYYDWPVGYELTGKLSDVWALEDHKLGETTFTHFPDGTAHKNRMQGNDFVQSAMYTHGLTCSTCHDAHGTEYPSSLRKAPDALCLDCHGEKSPNGPRAPTLAQHTHHAANSPGSSCVACHMPKIAQTLGDVNVRSHTFRFVPPSMTDSLGIPNACNVCHKDRSTAWATEALRSWADQSPWRVSL